MHVAKPNPGYSSGKLGEGLLIGQFRLADGRTAVLLHNHNPEWTLWPSIEFDAQYNQSQVVELDAIAGGEKPLLDDSPVMAGLQLNFQAGMARLLIMPL